MIGPRQLRKTRLRRGDLQYLSPLQAARVVEPAPQARWALWLMLAALLAALAWAALTRVDVVTQAGARVLAEGREQLVASLEGGILRELKVREGTASVCGLRLSGSSQTVASLSELAFSPCEISMLRP